ncbi:MAG TPA: MXAN_6640 family putative metalloprotease [Gemmatimonadales bacterium]
MRKVFSCTVVVLLPLVFASCVDQTDSPAGPSGSGPGLAAGGQGGGNGPTSLDLIEDDFADGLLDRDNANRYRQYAVSAPDRLPSKYRSSAKGKDATYSMLLLARDWDKLSASTRQEILDIRRNGYGNLSDTVATEHFVLHYTRQGNNAVPARDADGNGIPDFIDLAAQSWEEVWDREITHLGYPAPRGTPEQKFHVYYRDFAYYGVCYAENVELEATTPVALGTASAYIEVENDFYGFPPNDVDAPGAEVRSGALKVTQAHEFMHASQFNINVYQSGWLFESHATWAEDAVYDEINDWHWYINRFLSRPDLPLFNRYVYGSAYFMNYLSETYGLDAPRQVWLASRTRTTPDAVRSAGFGGSWENIKLFAPAEYLLGISDFTTDAPSIIPLPFNRIRATHSTYPVAVSVPTSTNKAPNLAPWGLGANLVEFEAGSARGTLRLSFSGTGGVAWRAMVALTGRSGTSVLAMPVNSDGDGTLDVTGFGTKWNKATLMPTIADRVGTEVPYSYGAELN